MIRNAGLQVPDINMNIGTGLGYGADYTGVPQSLYGAGLGGIETVDFLDRILGGTNPEVRQRAISTPWNRPQPSRMDTFGRSTW